MLIEIKRSLRQTNNALEPEIKDNIASALLELGRVGVNVSGLDCYSADADKLIVKACELYCKWQMNYMDKADRFEKSFGELRDALSVTTKYTEENP